MLEERWERRIARGVPWRPAGFGVLPGGSIWLNRGEKDIQFDISVEGGAEGRFSLESQVLEGKGSGSARLGGPMGGFPLDLRHLFPPGKLPPTGVPRTLGL